MPLFKKILSLVLALLLLTCLPLPVARAEGGAISLTGAEAARGEEFSISVCIDSNPGVMYLSLTPVYDARVLELLRMEAQGSGWYVGSKNAVWDGASDSTFTGQVLTLSFRVKENAPSGQSAVSLEVEAVNYREEEVPFELSEGRVTVPAPESGAPGPGSDSAPDAGSSPEPKPGPGPLVFTLRSFGAGFLGMIRDILRSLIPNR